MENSIEVLKDTITVLQSHRFKTIKRRDEIIGQIRSLDRLIYQLKQTELSLSFSKRKTKIEVTGLKELFCCLSDFEERVLEIIQDIFREANKNAFRCQDR